MLHKRLRRTFKDERLRLVAGHPFVAEGHDLRNVPAWLGVTAYVEQRFGAWTVEGGLARLGEVLAGRLATRGVTVLTGVEARDLVVREGRVAAVRTTAGDVEADAVVCAIDPRRLPALAAYVARTMPAIPPVVVHVGPRGRAAGPAARGGAARRPDAGGAATQGRALTVHGRGQLSEDILRALARHRIDVRAQVVARVDRSPRDQVEQWGGSPMGVLWQGRGDRAAAARAAHPHRRGVRRRGARDAGRRRCRSWGCRRRWWRPRSATPASRPPEGGVSPRERRTTRSDRHVEGREDLARRLGPVQRVEVQARCPAGQQLVAELGGQLDAGRAHRRRRRRRGR